MKRLLAFGGGNAKKNDKRSNKTKLNTKVNNNTTMDTGPVIPPSQGSLQRPIFDDSNMEATNFIEHDLPDFHDTIPAVSQPINQIKSSGESVIVREPAIQQQSTTSQPTESGIRPNEPAQQPLVNQTLVVGETPKIPQKTDTTRSDSTADDDQKQQQVKSLKKLLKDKYGISKSQLRELMRRNLVDEELNSKDMELLLQIQDLIGAKNFKKILQQVRDRVDSLKKSSIDATPSEVSAEPEQKTEEFNPIALNEDLDQLQKMIENSATSDRNNSLVSERQIEPEEHQEEEKTEDLERNTEEKIDRVEEDERSVIRTQNYEFVIASLTEQVAKLTLENKQLTNTLEEDRELIADLKSRIQQLEKIDETKISYNERKYRKMELENERLRRIEKQLRALRYTKGNLVTEMYELRNEIVDRITDFDNFCLEARFELDKFASRFRYQKTKSNLSLSVNEISQHSPLKFFERKKTNDADTSLKVIDSSELFQQDWNVKESRSQNLSMLSKAVSHEIQSDSEDSDLGETLSAVIDNTKIRVESSAKQRVFVYARLKPIEKFGKTSLQIIDNNSVEAISTTGREFFSLDRVYGPMQSQEILWEDIAHVPSYILESGKHKACFFTHGQTNSGKSYTLFGQQNDIGILPRFVSELFTIQEEKLETHRFRFSATCVELKGDILRDVLSTKNGMFAKTSMRQHLTRLQISDYEDYLKIMQIIDVSKNPLKEFSNTHDGNELLYAVKKSNPKLTLIITIHVEAMNLETLDCEDSQVSFIELAGSEKLNRGYKGRDAQTEFKKIQKNLIALTEVLAALQNETASREQSLKQHNKSALQPQQLMHIPYRNSKLTYFLSDVLQPDTLIYIYVSLLPEQENYHENMRSLKFASSIAIRSNVARETAQQQQLQTSILDDRSLVALNLKNTSRIMKSARPSVIPTSK